MKYIKSYKLFESKVDDIKDICLELEDDGIRVEISDIIFNVHYFPKGEKTIEIGSIYKTIKWSFVKDTLLRLRDYLSDDYLGYVIMDPTDKVINSGDEMNIDDDRDINLFRIYYKDDEDVQRITYSATNDSRELPHIYKLVGNVVSMDENDITTIDDILEPHKDYSPGHHSKDEDFVFRAKLFGRSVVQYPPIKTHMNQRSGYCWFLEDPVGDNRYRSHGVKLEVLINKLRDGYYIVHIDHNTDRDDFYLVNGLNQLKELINKKVLSLY